ncbi:MAG: bifunctional hydroxymethylpyrimidine kinase/phosphomethylpyrimidine kinase [Dehalococcoidia bacterium]
MNNVPRAMTIAGSDSGAGAGIQADLKTFAALGVYGTSVITAITAQNTLEVTQVLELPTDLVAAQIDTVMSDIGTDAAKTGMLSSSRIIGVVAERIKALGIPNLVVDPVMVAKSGARLLQEEAVQSLRDELLPLATVVTPNIPEAEVLVGYRLESMEDVYKAAREMAKMGAANVVIKGGHRPGPVTDVLYSEGIVREFTSPRVESENTHGTGCTFASAVAAYLALGREVEQAVYHAKEYVTEAIRAAFPIGKGHGPVHHFYRFWEG